MFKRLLKQQIEKNFFKGKVIILTGSRQVGKTTLALEILKNKKLIGVSRIFNADNPSERELLTEKDIDFLHQLIGNEKVVFIDEGQKVRTIGQTAKLLVDYYGRKKQILITGSSSIHLLHSTEESLTGRKFTYSLFPLSLEEIFPKKSFVDFFKNLETLLIYGLYPDIVKQKTFDEKRELLKALSTSSLYRDIFELSSVKNSDMLIQLLKALALQIGSEVSLQELSSLLRCDLKSVERCIELLEQSYIIFRLSPYARNKRREITKKKKIFFYDVGVRNAVINNFNPLNERNDVGNLWENFLIAERIKYQAYHKIYSNNYFWRTYDGSEVDLVEEREGKLFGYEIKWNEKDHKKRIPKKWLEYKDARYKIIAKTNLKGFVM